MADVKIARSVGDCSVDGCDRLATRVGAGLCEMHYARLRRRGSFRTQAEEAGKRPDLRHCHGYILEHLPHHPLATNGQRSRIYQHRAVYFEAHGVGPFQCHVCGSQVTWDMMHVDHLDDDKSNNDIANLAAACPTCNQARAKEKVARASRQRATQVFEHDGLRLTAQQWADRVGISRNALLWRLRNGWPLEVALSAKRGRFGPASAMGATVGRR